MGFCSPPGAAGTVGGGLAALGPELLRRGPALVLVWRGNRWEGLSGSAPLKPRNTVETGAPSPLFSLMDVPLRVPSAWAWARPVPRFSTSGQDLCHVSS